jgi:hypothetical protein
MSVADRIVQVLAETPALDEDQIADRLGIRRQQVNQECRTLVANGTLHRFAGAGGKIVNRLVEGSAPPPPAASPSVPPVAPSQFVSEDEVKAAVKAYLEELGYQVSVAWGRTPGIDIEATGPAGRFLIEAKGEVASQPQKTNYFLGALGELLQLASGIGLGCSVLNGVGFG